MNKITNLKKEQTEAEHIEGKIIDGRLGQFHKDVHSLTYDPDRLERSYDKHAQNYDEFLLELAGDGTSGCSYYQYLRQKKTVEHTLSQEVLSKGR